MYLYYAAQYRAEMRNMLKIGDFSKLSRISIRMLRHYDEMGLLIPDYVDSFTGYRHYSETQLQQAAMIQALKNMGFALSVIKEILEQIDQPEKLEQLLQIKRKELEEEQNKTKQRIQSLDSTLKWLRKDGTMMEYNVTLKEMPARYVASVRQEIPTYNHEGMLWEMMHEETKTMNLQVANPCYSLAVFHDKGFVESNPDVEIQTAVAGNYADTEHVKFRQVEAQQIASATYQGSYEQISRVNEAVANWVMENGYEFDGSSFCIYHVSPAQTSNPEELVTEVCYPVRKK